MQANPYLLFSVFLFALATAGALVNGQRKTLFWGGLLALPNVVLELAFIPSYWSPDLIFGGPFGLEDVLFSFAAGVLAIGLALAPFRARFPVSRVRLPGVMTRWLGLELLFLAIFGLLRASGLPVMPAALTGMGGVALYLWFRSGRLAPLALAGGAGFGLLYSTLLAGAFLLWPHWPATWNEAQLSAFRPLGLFAEEVAWGLGFGAVHAWGTGHILDLGPTGAG